MYDKWKAIIQLESSRDSHTIEQFQRGDILVLWNRTECEQNMIKFSAHVELIQILWK